MLTSTIWTMYVISALGYWTSVQPLVTWIAKVDWDGHSLDRWVVLAGIGIGAGLETAALGVMPVCAALYLGYRVNEIVVARGWSLVTEDASVG